jgi:hypothetical protein
MAGSRGTHIAGWIRGRRRIPAIAIAAVSAAVLTGAFTSALSSKAAAPTLTRQQFAQNLLKTEAAKLLTAPAQTVLRMVASGGKQLSGLNSQGLASGTVGQTQAGPAGPGAALPKAAFSNVRVNDPSLDTHEPDQTTQSETSIAVAGSHVAVGYNDSQQTGLFLTAGSSLTGYSYSDDGGASFTDGGPLPNTPEFVNFGDPWMASDRAGSMYFSNLAFDVFNFNLDVAVAKSTDGGKTWGTPVPVFRPPINILYFADKDALTAGPDPVTTSRDDIYATWDDFSFNFNTDVGFTGLPVARSTDGGATWHLAYAKKFPLSETSCSFQQFIGATPLVNHANGTLYVAAEKFAVKDPNCTGMAKPKLSEWIFRSTDGGRTFAPGVKIAGVTAAVPDGLLFLGPGKYMRTAEFPTLAIRGKTLFAAWNDGSQGKSHIKLATSTNAGQTWTSSFVTSGSGDEVQPALSSDSAGIHLLYYHRNPNNTLDVFAGTSKTGKAFVTKRVTTQSSPGALTFPQFDPIIAFGYMGDYIANVSDGTHQYYAWGDNRDTVTDFLYPNGRADPDVFFAKH